MSGFGLMMSLSEQKGFREGSPGRQLHRRKGLSHSSFGGQNWGQGGMSRIFHFKQGETETQRGDATSPRSLSLSRVAQDSGLQTPSHMLLPVHQDVFLGTFPSS